MSLSQEDTEKIDKLKQFVKNKKGKPTPARTKVLKFCLNKTYEIYKEQMRA
jgi:hypothetical protein